MGAAGSMPAVTAEQMREVDRAMVEDLHIQLVQMMENAGRTLAELALELFEPGSAAVLAGPGGNGGGGMVAARHLANRGVEVHVILSHPISALAAVPAHQLDIVRRMGLPVKPDPEEADLVVDALLGYSLRGEPRGRVGELIGWANAQASPVLALDTPSGLDVTTGVAAARCVRAAVTLTLALPKVGLLRARDHVGRLYLADISVPPLVYRRLGIEVPSLFREGAVVEVGHDEDDGTPG